MNPIVPKCLRLKALLLWCLASATDLRGQAIVGCDIGGTGSSELLRGVVRGEDGKPIALATIFVTRAPDRTVLHATSSADGSWRIRCEAGTGDYLVFVAATGKESSRKRVTRGLDGFPAVNSPDSIFVVDLTLKTAVPETLETIEVRDEKPRPPRSTWNAELPPIGAAETEVSGFLGALSPDEIGHLESLIRTTPGIAVVSGGLSALGLRPNQNSTTLGGLQFAGADLPRDARTFARVATSTLDPSRGWFGGAQTEVELSPGSQFDWRQGHLTIDAPALQLANTTSRNLGLPVTSLDASYGQEGALAHDHVVYSIAVQAGRRAQTAFSLSDASRVTLQALGIAPDSALQLIALARSFGFPSPGVANQSSWGARTTDRLNVSARIGTPLYDYEKGMPPRRVVSATMVGSWRQSDGFSLDPSQTDSRSGAGSNRFLMGQLLRSAYITSHDWLLELRTGLSAGEDVLRARFSGPGAFVAVSSTASADSAGAGSALAVGGNSALNGRRRMVLWELQSQLSLFADKPSNHKVALSGDLRFDVKDEMEAVDRAGTYVYSSLADFASQRAGSFSRTLATPIATAGVWNGYVGIVDEWRASAALSVLYGFRAEANYFTTKISGNADLMRALGVRTDVTPNTTGISPRLGFRWRRSIRGIGSTQSELGTISRPGAGTVRGGVGDFRSFLGPDVLIRAQSHTGLTNAASRLVCIGAAVPVPTWDAWASGDTSYPDGCAGGAPRSLTDSATSISALAPAFTAPRSLRANLSWSGVRFGTAWDVTGIYSLNRNQPGMVDANFGGTLRFVSSGDDRPIFVPVSSIDPISGFLSSADGRSNSTFGSVLVLQSQLRSVSRQATVSVAPAFISGKKGWITASYTLASTRQQSTGFDGATFGDPRVKSWSRGDVDVRHQFIAQAGAVLGPATFILYASIASGLPYSPMVGTDINGDGLANDIAVVPASDSALRRSLDALARRSAAVVQRCLNLVVRGPVERNACEGPWTALLNARVALSGRALGLGERTRIGINLTNPLAGLDQLLHGANLRGWGGPAYPDPTLLQARGFSVAQKRYSYAVNPRFGDTGPTATGRLTPFRVTLDVSVDFARTLPQQQVAKWYGPGRNSGRLSPDDVRKRYMRNYSDPYRAILADPDTLLLTPAQIEKLLVARNSLRARADSAWRATSEELAGVNQQYDGARFVRKQDETAEAVWELSRLNVRATLPAILSPAQLSIVPGLAGLFLRQALPKKHLNFFL